MKIVKILAAQKDRRITVILNTSERIILKPFGKDVVAMDKVPARLAKSGSIYLALKRACANSIYFTDQTTQFRSLNQISEIRARLKCFIGVDLKEI